MTLQSPIIITPRLLPGVRVGNAFVSIEYAKRQGREGRTRYQWHIDLNRKSFSGDDLQSGCQGGSLQQGLESLLSLLSAAGESYNYKGLDGYNASMFPEPVTKWASDNCDELSLLSLELEENKNLIEE